MSGAETYLLTAGFTSAFPRWFRRNSNACLQVASSMGASLPKPISCTVLERHGDKHFRVGVAEMNGWRNSMEDAHVIHMTNGEGYFGILDGHGGGECSVWCSQRLQEQLAAHGCPKDDAAAKKLLLDTDQAFLSTGMGKRLDPSQPNPSPHPSSNPGPSHNPSPRPSPSPSPSPGMGSGSTAAMCVVRKPVTPGGKYRLHVINAGDSRVLLSRADGSIVDGGGTDQGLTIDHKPDHPSERARIERCELPHLGTPMGQRTPLHAPVGTPLHAAAR